MVEQRLLPMVEQRLLPMVERYLSTLVYMPFHHPWVGTTPVHPAVHDPCSTVLGPYVLLLVCQMCTFGKELKRGWSVILGLSERDIPDILEVSD